jgi:PBP1b-binding outer membrane lipoprotein LpoB
MNLHSGMKLGALLLLVTAILLTAGCTQTPAVPATTTTPVPAATTAKPVATTAPPAATTAPVNATAVQPNVTAVKPNVTAAVKNYTALKAELATLAGSFANKTNGTVQAAALKEGPNSTAFATALAQLKTFKASDSRIKYLYTLTQQNGTVRFVVDADYGTDNGSAFLEEYKNATPELYAPLKGPIGVGPYTDPWGTFVSGLAPVNTGSNKTVIIIGVDFEV